MAVINISCPQCATGYKIDEAHRGRKTTCKKCGHKFAIGDESMEEPVTSASTAAPAAPSPTDADSAKDRPSGADGIPLDWEPGDIILDLYEVVKLPGTKYGYAEGGMGRVNLVRHREWQRDIAVKSVLPAKSASARDIENFTKEAEQWVDTIGLHPNIVVCHYVRVLGGVPRVFIEYVDGGTLQEWITSKRLYEGGPKAALERILDVAIQTAWGLHYVHELGLIHQDVKPLNVMMTADGAAKVTDFGLAGAKAVAFEENEQRPEAATILATYGGMTPAYCSPEQADIAAKRKAGTPREQRPKLTRRTDVWSWAASVLEMFLGERSWPEGQVAYLGLQREPDEPHLPPMPSAVKVLLGICFKRRPEDRPHDLMKLADPLQSIYQQVTGQTYSREQPKLDALLADSLNNRAVSLIDLKKPEAAEKKWQEALGVDPHHPEATYNWGLIQWRSALLRDDQLLGKLREVRTSCADSERVDFLLGLVHLERNDCDAAIRILSKAGKTGFGRVEIASALTLAQSRVTTSTRLIRTFEGHTDSVEAVAWSPDGRYAISGSEDYTLRLWEVSSGKCLKTLEGNESYVRSVSWSPNGRWILSGSEDYTMCMWEVSSGKCLRIFEHTNHVRAVSWSPDSRFALSGSNENTLRQREVSSGKCLRTFDGHTNGVYAVSWSPNGRYALSGSEDNTLRLWEVSTGKCLNTFGGHTAMVTSVSWSPDGRNALSGSRDSTLRLWEISSGKCLRTMERNAADVNSVSWSPDGHRALSGSAGEVLRLWEISNGQCLRTFEGHTDMVNCVSWSPDGRFALSGSRDHTLRLWEVAFAKQPAPLTTSIAFPVSSAPYRHQLQQVRDSLARNPAVAAGFLQQARQQPGCSRREDALELTRLLSRSLAHRSFLEGWQKRIFEGHTNTVTSVSWRADGRFALSGSLDNTLRLWEVCSGKCIRIFEGPAAETPQDTSQEEGASVSKHPADLLVDVLRLAFEAAENEEDDDALLPLDVQEKMSAIVEKGSQGNARDQDQDERYTEFVFSVAWNPDSRYALSASWDKTLRLWDVSSGKCLRTLEGHVSGVNSVSWSPDGRYSLSGSEDKTLRLWEVSRGKCLRTFEGHTSGVESVSWSPDGRFALSGSDDKTLRLWDVSNGKCLRIFEGHSNYVNSVSWSPDGRYALSGSRDKTLRLWEVASGKCLRIFEGHSNYVNSVSWSPDGRYALSGSIDNTLRLWEVNSGKNLRIFEGHTSTVTSVSWSPDGRFALSGSFDNTLRLWELDWEFELNQPADWNGGARHFVTTFLTLHTPYSDGLVRHGKPTWTEDDFRSLLDKLGCAGYGWLRPEGVRRELNNMAATWQGPPP